MIPRPLYSEAVSRALLRSPVTALLGPRQCGKTTLARLISQEREGHYFDMESPVDRQRLQNPELMLGSLSGLVIIDEIQLVPELFGILRVLADRPGRAASYLVLGSASPHIIKRISESLAGRIEFVDLSGFNLAEVTQEERDLLWLRGGFPRSFLAGSEADSLAWREGFIRTFLERDIPQLGVNIPATAMRRFWTMLSHLHGQTWNASDLGRSMGLSDKTVRHYLDILTGTYMVRQLQPWHENLKKRQIKSPKVYLRDSGLLHSLLNIHGMTELWAHPRLGASWEGFCLEQVVAVLNTQEVYFWATQGGAELDLLFFSGGRRFGVEFKFNEAPKVTKSMQSALTDLTLAHLWVVYPGTVRYAAHEKITMLPLAEITGLPAELSK